MTWDWVPSWLRPRTKSEADEDVEAMKSALRQESKTPRTVTKKTIDASQAVRVAKTMRDQNVTEEEARSLVEAENHD